MALREAPQIRPNLARVLGFAGAFGDLVGVIWSALFDPAMRRRRDATAGLALGQRHRTCPVASRPAGAMPRPRHAQAARSLRLAGATTSWPHAQAAPSLRLARGDSVLAAIAPRAHLMAKRVLAMRRGMAKRLPRLSRWGSLRKSRARCSRPTSRQANRHRTRHG